MELSLLILEMIYNISIMYIFLYINYYKHEHCKLLKLLVIRLYVNKYNTFSAYTILYFTFNIIIFNILYFVNKVSFNFIYFNSALYGEFKYI